MARKLASLLAGGMLASSLAGAQTAKAAVPTYYEDRAATVCSNTPCVVSFSAIPSGEFVTIDNIACYITTSSTSVQVLKVYLSVSGQNRNQNLPSQAHQAGTQNIVDFNIPIKFKLGAGRTPFIYVLVTSSTTTYIECSITGTPSSD